MYHKAHLGWLALGLVLVACQPAAGPASAPASNQSAAAPRAAGPDTNRAMVMAVRYEGDGLARKATTARGTNATLRVFNAQLTYVDGKGATNAYLLESL